MLETWLLGESKIFLNHQEHLLNQVLLGSLAGFSHGYLLRWIGRAARGAGRREQWCFFAAAGQSGCAASQRPSSGAHSEPDPNSVTRGRWSDPYASSDRQ